MGKLITEDEVKEIFTAAITKSLEEGNKDRKPTYHVTSLVYGCPRKSIWEKRDAEIARKLDIEGDGIFKVWMGTELHKTPITKMHEVELQYEKHGIVLTGTIDEVIELDGKFYILDKKFVDNTPREMRPHHRTQVAYYAVLLKLLKYITVEGIILLYYNTGLRDEWRVTPFIEPFTDTDYINYENELNSRMKDIADNEKNALPPNIFSKAEWICGYCKYREICKREWQDNHDNS